MDEYYDYKKLNIINEGNHKELDELKNMCISLDKAEDDLREKIVLKYQELEKLKHAFNNIIETYSHIIRSSVKSSNA
jgi:hypothetical protein